MRPTADQVGDVAAVALGAAAFGASALHVYSVCRDNGGKVAEAVLTVAAVELLALVSMLELRRAARAVPVAGLALGVAATVTANLAASQTPARGYGWDPRVVSVAPAVLFVAVLLIVKTRPAPAGYQSRRARAARKSRVEAERAAPAPAGQQSPRGAEPPPPLTETPKTPGARPATARQIAAAAGIPADAAGLRQVQRRLSRARAGSETDARWLAGHGYRPDGTLIEPEEDARAVGDTHSR